MRILVFGVNGMLGHKMYQSLGKSFDVYGTIRSEFESISRFGIFTEGSIIENVDAFDPDSIRLAIEKVKPDVVVNAIGVIKQLPTSKDVIQALTINSILPHRLAELAREFGFRLITISTDCVFDGSRGNYSETDAPDARDHYGISKLLGEVNVSNALTIRTSIIGRELETTHSIVEWFLANRGGSVKGYTDAIYTGFPTVVLADIVSNIIAEHPDLSGIWHLSSEKITKYELLVLLNEHFEAGIQIILSDEVAIDRSLDSSQFRQQTGFSPLPWNEMIAQMVSDPTTYEKWRRQSAAI